MLDLTKPVQTRDGRPVRLLSTDLKGSHPIAGVLAATPGFEGEWVEQWLPDGSSYSSQTQPSVQDLVNVPEETISFHNAHRYSSGAISLGFGFDSADAAVEGNIPGDYLGTVQLTFADGKLSDASLELAGVA